MLRTIATIALFLLAFPVSSQTQRFELVPRGAVDSVIAPGFLILDEDGFAALPVRTEHEILDVGRLDVAGGPSRPIVYVLQDTSSPIIELCFRVLFSNEIVDVSGLVYVGTSEGESDADTFHVFKVSPATLSSSQACPPGSSR